MASSKAGAFSLGMESSSPFVLVLIVFVLALFALDTAHGHIRKTSIFRVVWLEPNPAISGTRRLLHLRISCCGGTSAPLGQQGKLHRPWGRPEEPRPFPWKHGINDSVTGAQ